MAGYDSSQGASSSRDLSLSKFVTAHTLYSSLLVFSFLGLPRTKHYFTLDASSGTGSIPVQHVSADRPEPAWLTPITSDPANTLIWTAAGVAVSSAWYGGYLREWWNAGKKPQDVQGKFKSARDAFLATVVASGLIHCTALTLGAPMSSLASRSYLASLELAFLSVYPVIYALGMPSLYEAGTFDRYRLTRLFCEFSPRNPIEIVTVYPAVAGFIGAWCGVIPLALDWDRPWQSYPLPPVFGAIVGVIAGGYAAFGRLAGDEIVEFAGAVASASAENQNTPQEGTKAGGNRATRRKKAKAQ